MNTILVVNAGSSSVKFQLFATDRHGALTLLVRGNFDGVGTKPRLRGRGADGNSLVDRAFEAREIADIPSAMRAAGDWLRDTQKLEPSAVGHRVAHGGPDYDRPVLIDDRVLADLERYVPLAPLHQPNNLSPIRAIRARFPQLPQVACFDTAFHRGHGPVVDHFAIPEKFYAEGVRRYGFHGLSYEFIAERLQAIAPEIAHKRVIVAHLGSGASMCALHEGRSIETTMGFTPLDGLPMGTRPGQIDPGVLLHLIQQKGMAPAEVQDMLYRDSGLKGLSGVSNDMRELLASSSPGAALAIDYFVYRVGLQTGLLAAALGGVDAFVFTAGVGENSAPIRARIAEKLRWLGADLDAAANEAANTKISTPQSRVGVYVVPTDEELMIARHTLAVVSRHRVAEPAGHRIA
jgi:acetate kinase